MSAVTPDGTGYLSGIVATGQLRSVVPGRVRVLKSRDFSTWTDIEVDYRAVANRTTLAAPATTTSGWPPTTA